MNHIMLDLETMGNGPDAAIVAIGAVGFDPVAGVLGDEFYRKVDLESSVKLGMKIDASTVLWWMQQSGEARREIYSDGGVDITIALFDFAEWVPYWDKINVWGNGARFDNAILGCAYQAWGAEPPWKFWNDRCYRTVKSLYPNIQINRTGTHHNALDDAKSQAEHLCRIYKEAGWTNI